MPALATHVSLKSEFLTAAFDRQIRFMTLEESLSQALPEDILAYRAGLRNTAVLRLLHRAVCAVEQFRSNPIDDNLKYAESCVRLYHILRGTAA